jgi:hypothetical protein
MLARPMGQIHQRVCKSAPARPGEPPRTAGFAFMWLETIRTRATGGEGAWTIMRLAGASVDHSVRRN